MKKRFQVNLTYQCNLQCEYCIQFVDKIRWEDPMEVELDDLVLAGKILRESEVDVSLLRVSGGEPTMHPQFEKCMDLIADWDKQKFILCTNGIQEKPIKHDIRYRISKPGRRKRQKHTPPMVSPFDLGMKIPKRPPIYCIIIHRCGILFDAHGFAPCGNAAPLGRLLRRDPYDTKPVTAGFDMEMCKHCYSILSKEERNELSVEIKAGRLEYPTKTYREGLERDKEEPFVFKTFKQRLAEESK